MSTTALQLIILSVASSGTIGSNPILFVALMAGVFGLGCMICALALTHYLWPTPTVPDYEALKQRRQAAFEDSLREADLRAPAEFDEFQESPDPTKPFISTEHPRCAA